MEPLLEAAEPIFGGRLFKLTSVLASMATAKFNSVVPELVPSKAGKLATFDARVFQAPSLEEAANVVLWRWFDARKNSISMAAQDVFSHKQLHGVDSQGKIELLHDWGIKWDKYPDFFKWGTFVRRETVQRELTWAELQSIPAQHRPTGPVTRNEYVAMNMPPFDQVANRVEVLLYGAEPKLVEITTA